MVEDTISPPVPKSTIEQRSIEFVPNDERHGTVHSVGAIWFVSNINLTAMATGTAALALGAGLLWTVIGTVLGSLFGSFFMAFHSSQGPQLGLPQLVQSRPQFGYIGAALTVFLAVLSTTSPTTPAMRSSPVRPRTRCFTSRRGWVT